jgi:hypothetical protein
LCTFLRVYILVNLLLGIFSTFKMTLELEEFISLNTASLLRERLFDCSVRFGVE